MKLQNLLQQRRELLRQTRLANAAYVYRELGVFAERIARGNLRGQVTLFFADPGAQRAWPSLVADEGSQSVLEEHFLEVDVLDLADLLFFASGGEPRESIAFRLEELGSRFRPGLRQELESAGVELPSESELTEDRSRE